MERPERPTRHKSNPMKHPIRPSFSSDSESEWNDSDVPIQITYYQRPSESASGSSGASSSTAVPQTSTSNLAGETSSNMMRVSPTPLRVTLSPIPSISSREEEPRPEPLEQDPLRRKRSSAASSAASVIFDSVETLIGSNSSNQDEPSPERPSERFQHSDYVIRPRSFCNIVCGNAIRPPVYKIKRPNGPIDLTPSTSYRDPSCSAPVVTSSFSLRDTATLPSGSDSAQSSYYNRSSAAPYVIPPRTDQSASSSYVLPQPRTDQSSSSSSSILRQFDEMCTTPQIRRRPRGYSLRNHSSLDDYCDLVGNFLINYQSSGVNSEIGRSPTVQVTQVDRLPMSETQSSSTADIISRHITSSPVEIINEPASIIGEINSFLGPAEPNRNIIADPEPMEQSNDDVIVVETPERPPLPDSPDPFMVPSSRSPSPPPPAPSHKRTKAQSSHSADVPMTLQDLNQTLVSLLECPVCLDHATPPIYQCCKGHILCQSCHPRLTTCPICRSRLPGDRNSAMEKVAEKLMYPCKNTVTGCSMMLKLDDKHEHEEGCGFRHYACIVTTCHWKGYKPELVVHLQSSHPDKLITGTTKEVHVPLTGTVGGSMFISHHWIQSAHNEVFNVIFHVDLYKRIMKGCVLYIGSPDKAEKFTYLFELKQRVPPFRKLSYSRATHADKLKPGQPLCLSNDFSINIDMARLYRPEDCSPQTIPIFISILQTE